ncbi:TetR/AcrR family transcriptional regulator [Bradyrhizobium jicamae]|uniref:TetR/AcrR family transcriptional regulator n=1 Tax=Bradyrhizobium jicamae TaxID=280332 RepID=A0ABS5FF56_9BRAD|nr:TetR/AcrR family transcriptional regulator [Bradyrhizobium jicamae]MBR0795309.1 TetR/AcrR family transcriptional regulator [Bradyrhizobium jicamae]MBR0932731.1 TetR/AcrR family transcriptional regulator [Bradyrhizobium jicamae]
MSNTKDPKPTSRLSRGMLAVPPPRQKLRSRRESSAEPKYAPRRTQAERSETTRKLLLDAATKLIRRNGFGGLRTIEVAELAGVSRGALLHHFPSKHDLVVAVLTYVNEMTFAQSTRRAQLARSSGDPIGDIIEDAMDFFFGDPFFIGLAIAMSDESTRRLRRETSELTRQTRFSIEAAWLDTLISSGLPRQLAGDVLALTLSVVRGFSVRTLLENDPEQFSRLMSLWRTIVGEYIAASISRRPRKRT